MSDNRTAFTSQEFSSHLHEFCQVSKFAGVGAPALQRMPVQSDPSDKPSDVPSAPSGLPSDIPSVSASGTTSSSGVGLPVHLLGRKCHLPMENKLLLPVTVIFFLLTSKVLSGSCNAMYSWEIV